MDFTREGFVELDTREPLQGGRELESELARLIVGSIRTPNFAARDVYVDNVYQRGREYFFNIRVEIDYYNVEPDENYIGRWKIRDIYSREQKLRTDLQDIEVIRLPSRLARFYPREIHVDTRIYPYNDHDQGTMMNYDIMVTIRGELVDTASLSRELARGS